MKAKELKTKSKDELLKLLNDFYIKLREYRFQAAVRKIKNPHLIKATRQDIARILTILIANTNTNEVNQ